MAQNSHNKPTTISALQYYFYAVGIPILAVLALVYVLYSVCADGSLKQLDKVLIFAVPVLLGVGLYWRIRRNWIHQQDGSYIHIPQSYFTHPSRVPHSSAKAPEHFDIVAYYSKFNAFLMAGSGAVVMVFAVYAFEEGYVLLPLFILLLGSILLVGGIKNAIDPRPQLKLSPSGIWTARLGYRSKDEIRELKVFTKRRYKSAEWILEIYLKASSQIEADDEISLSSLNRCDEIIDYIQRLDLKKWIAT